MRTPDYTRKAVKKYQQKLTSIVIRLNPESEIDKPIIDFMNTSSNKTALIKELITKYMESINERT